MALGIKHALLSLQNICFLKIVWNTHMTTEDVFKFLGDKNK